MNHKIEPILKRIDLEFSKRTKSEAMGLLFMPGLLVGFLSYYFLFDIAEDYKNKITHESRNMSGRISSDKSYLRTNSDAMMASIKQKLKNYEVELDELINANKYLEYKMSRIDYLFYNQEIWGTFINKISQNAQKNHIQILNFSNQLADSNNTFGHLLDISIVSKSDFKQALRFINYLESNDLVVDVHQLQINIDERNILTDMNISIWGISQ